MTDEAIRERILAEFAKEEWAPSNSVGVEVKDGAVTLKGTIFDARQRPALKVAAENTPGVKTVHDRLVWIDPGSGLVIDASEEDEQGNEARRAAALRRAPRTAASPNGDDQAIARVTGAARSRFRRRPVRRCWCARPLFLPRRRLPFLLPFTIADEVQRPRLDAHRAAPMHQRVLFAMRDPDLSGARLANGFGEPVPIAMIGDDERQLDAALTRSSPHAHPAGSEGGERIGETPRPQILDSPWRA